MERLETKLDKWKTDLEHSDLMVATSLGLPKAAPAPHGEVGKDDEVGEDDEVDGDDEADDGEENLAVGVTQTKGHCEFVGGELHMVDDEAGCRDEDDEMVSI